MENSIKGGELFQTIVFNRVCPFCVCVCRLKGPFVSRHCLFSSWSCFLDQHIYDSYVKLCQRSFGSVHVRVCDEISSMLDEFTVPEYSSYAVGREIFPHVSGRERARLGGKIFLLFPSRHARFFCFRFLCCFFVSVVFFL